MMDQGPKRRVMMELSELLARTVKLDEFLDTVGYGKLSSDDQADLAAQLDTMATYCGLLGRRLTRELLG